MHSATFATVEAEHPMRGVAVVRLIEPPTVLTWPTVVDAVDEAVHGAEIVVLAGPGWQSSQPAKLMTETIVQHLRSSGVDVSLGHAA